MIVDFGIDQLRHHMMEDPIQLYRMVGIHRHRDVHGELRDRVFGLGGMLK